MNILDQLADYARERVARDKAQVALETLNCLLYTSDAADEL